ncbi:hypothetical protein [Methylocapsa sp. S129]|uniref:hypothetical protein n=1 Tax=Methylocapsa sp. S129 TaxID=1641869 RepID=UPI00131D4ABD|nr:hypothetical protein [Methylocapsa sp. S129]
MRRSLLFGVIAVALILALGAANALAATPSDQSVFVARGQQAQAAVAGAGLIEGRSAYNGDQAQAEHREDLAVIIRSVIVLGIAGLVFSLSAVGAKALWVLDEAESSSHGWPRWPNG